uniref:Uncharacterized protein n=1 Tax=Picea glauca TaxID=3330 RepID=A0A101LTZ1_PICGL|nr:hypothetical protein ABT39_MTgene4065 [Picea glauca]KUM45103.1 hypothetical protein ABT39_MTgene4074 [Picea glauca]
MDKLSSLQLLILLDHDRSSRICGELQYQIYGVLLWRLLH